MTFPLLTLSYSRKRKICKKRVQKKQLKKYKEFVDKIIEVGQVEINGSTFNSIADLTLAFYSTNTNCSFHYNIQK